MILDYFIFAINGIKQRKMRSWLTMLGIFIGIAAVVSLISIGQGLQDSIAEQFQDLGSDKIIIKAKSLGPPGTAAESVMLTTSQLEKIKNLNGVKDAAGFLMKTGQVEYRGETEVVFIFGVDPEKAYLFGDVIKLDKGRELNVNDKYKAVVGNNHAFGNLWSKPLDVRDKITINGQSFKVVGISKKVGNPFDDDSVTIPKEVVRDLFNTGDEESEIIVLAEKDKDPIELAEEIKRELRKIRNEKEGQETFIVQTADELLETFGNIFGIVSAVLVGIAAISLLVGGVGIMNTMYTSVLERTKDIGTMKAIGAKNSDIMLIFLIESGFLGFVGGAIGVLIGIGIAKSVELIALKALGTGLLKASISPLLIGGALLFSFITGAVSGVMPARQAAKLKPVKALRYE